MTARISTGAQLVKLGRKLGKQNDYHWFDKDTMDAWKTKIIGEVFCLGKGQYLFLDSSTFEVADIECVKYSVREFDSNTGGVKTLESFLTLKEAEDFAYLYQVGRE